MQTASFPSPRSVPMSSSARVLVVSQDEMLLRTRELILGAFFKVQGAGRMSEAKALITNRVFDLIVLCHSVAEAECEQLVDLAQDRQLGVDAGPYGLLKECAEMLGYVLKSKAKAAHI